MMNICKLVFLTGSIHSPPGHGEFSLMKLSNSTGKPIKVLNILNKIQQSLIYYLSFCPPEAPRQKDDFLSKIDGFFFQKSLKP